MQKSLLVIQMPNRASSGWAMAVDFVLFAKKNGNILVDHFPSIHYFEDEAVTIP